MTFDLEVFLAEQLEAIDSVLAQRGMEPHMRPLWAAITFVQECIVDIRGAGSKEGFLDQPWFARLNRMVEKWYKARYGPDLLRGPGTFASALCVVFDTPFRVEVPLTILEVVRPRESAWLHIPTSIHHGESVLDWIVGPPNLGTLSAPSRKSLEQSIREVATAMRLISADFMTAILKSEQEKSLAKSVLSHLRKAVEDICAGQPELRSQALWELHLAVEKTLKIFVRQHGGKLRRTHALDKLHDDAQHVGLHPLPGPLLAALPTAREAIGHRYGEMEPPCLNCAFDAYRAAIGVIVHCAAAFTRQFMFRDTSFLLRTPPWASDEA